MRLLGTGATTLGFRKRHFVCTENVNLFSQTVSEIWMDQGMPLSHVKADHEVGVLSSSKYECRAQTVVFV